MNTTPLSSQTAQQQLHWWYFFSATILLFAVGLMGASSCFLF